MDLFISFKNDPNPNEANIKKTAREVFEIELGIVNSYSKCEVSDKENYSSELILNFILLYNICSHQSKA